MIINCSCGNSSRFLIPLWLRVTFRFDEDGTISILHVKPLESLEEKLTDQNMMGGLVCRECGSPVEIIWNEYEKMEGEDREKKALEGL